MRTTFRLWQPLLCVCGIHVAPPPRVPEGPVVAACTCCRKVVYFYGLSAHGIRNYPLLPSQEFPRVVGMLSTGPG